MELWWEENKGIVFVLIFFIVILLILVGLLFGCSSDNASKATPKGQYAQSVQEVIQVKQESKIESVPEQIGFTGTAKQLLQEFDDNEIAADRKYSGKLAIVTGRIGLIDEGTFGGLTLSLRDEYDFSGVQCSFENEQDLLTLSKGQTVTMKGLVTGKTISYVFLKECTIIKNKENTNPQNVQNKTIGLSSLKVDLGQLSADQFTVTNRNDYEWHNLKIIVNDYYTCIDISKFPSGGRLDIIPITCENFAVNQGVTNKIEVITDEGTEVFTTI